MAWSGLWFTVAIIANCARGVCMGEDDDSLFRDEMAGVTPLEHEPRAHRRGGAGRQRDSSLAQRRRAAVASAVADRNTLADGGIEPLDAWYVSSWKRPGIQHGVFRRLKQGRYESQARLDLHRMGVEQARRELYEFVTEAFQLGLRSLLVVHGKGRTAGDQGSILKGCVDHWLRELDAVQAFHSAQPQHGGTGAVYVLLRKSESAKQATREQFSRGRSPTE